MPTPPVPDPLSRILIALQAGRKTLPQADREIRRYIAGCVRTGKPLSVRRLPRRLETAEAADGNPD